MKSTTTTENPPPSLIWDETRLAAPHDQADKAHRVRRMFDAIAPTYALINTLATGGRDRAWRREMARLADVQPDDILLDVACGTGDVARTFARSNRAPAHCIGLDFSERMLAHASGKPAPTVSYWRGDALMVPLADARVHIVTCAFGIRNFQNLMAGLREMHRVLAPGGRAIILECSVPANRLLRALYLWYFQRVMPIAATWISRDRTGAYRYLPSSVVSFQGREELRDCLLRAGFAKVTLHPRAFGSVTIYRAVKLPGNPRRNSAA